MDLILDCIVPYYHHNYLPTFNYHYCYSHHHHDYQLQYDYTLPRLCELNDNASSESTMKQNTMRLSPYPGGGLPCLPAAGVPNFSMSSLHLSLHSSFSILPPLGMCGIGRLERAVWQIYSDGGLQGLAK